jgi:predicted transposase YbfD/YdcC
MWERLERVPDPRSRQGRIYPLPSLVAIAVCAMTAAGHDSLDAVGQWVARAGQDELARLRVPADPLTGLRPAPDESTVRRLLARIDPRALTRALLGPRPRSAARRAGGAAGGGPSRRTRAARAARRQRIAARTAVQAGRSGQVVASRWPAVAVDGKTSRGARRPDGSRVHLLGVVDHLDGVLLDQVEVDAKSNETTAFQPLLTGLELVGVTVTFDAMHSVRANLDWLVSVKGGHYLAVIKANQPSLLARLKALPWADVPAGHTTRDHGHGRDETRTVKAVTVTEQAGGLDFAHARQAVRITRWRQVKGRTASRETVYAVTDLDARAGPHVLNRLARQHWSIENRQHYVRDVSQAEDSCTTRTGRTPTNLATIRSAIINTLRRNGYQHIPEGRRDHTSPAAALALHGLA